MVQKIAQFDLLVVGHRGRGEKQLPAHLLLGSVAERLVVGADFTLVGDLK
jgi:nucleotide-binding universal stress UspA family protein